MNPKDKTQLRKQAEQLLNNRHEFANITELTAKDDLQLIEEMQVYLAELELKFRSSNWQLFANQSPSVILQL